VPHMFMEHDKDPKGDLLQKIGNIEDFAIANNQVLVAIYIRPEKTKSGIYLSDNYRDEDKYQSKAALVIKKGPIAFEDSTGTWFKDFNVDVNDWVIYRPSDGWSINVNGVPCRMLEDTSIKGRIPSPDVIF
jgi:co-chaperonin GroES (HSP10)